MRKTLAAAALTGALITGVPAAAHAEPTASPTTGTTQTDRTDDNDNDGGNWGLLGLLGLAGLAGLLKKRQPAPTTHRTTATRVDTDPNLRDGGLDGNTRTNV